MQRIPRALATRHAFNHADTPALTVKQGESFVVETEDALDGDIRSADIAGIHAHWYSTEPHGNPSGGPVFVEGAEQGDLLAVTIERITVDDQGVTVMFPGAGPLADSVHWRAAAEPFAHVLRHVPGPSGTTRDGVGIMNDTTRWTLRPFIGTLGVAPEREVQTTVMGQGPWGGNLDCREFCEGSTVLLNCSHPGGLLYLGDVHASQGDTEFYGSADEARAEVQVRCEVIKNKKAAFVRVVKPESIVSVFCSRPLEHAVESAILDLMSWMVEEYGLSQRDACLHAGINPDFRVHVYQMFRSGRLEYTAGAEIPKRYLSPG